MSLWENDQIQFARLLAELQGVLPRETVEQVAESMDLTPDKVGELLDRAAEEWEQIKAVTLANPQVEFPTKGTQFALVAPNGERIIGTFEQVPGAALATTFELDSEGKIRPEYEGTTELYWDEQESKMLYGQVQYVGEDGMIWLENQVKPVPVGEPK
jgi:hypothetical protein